MRPMDEAPMDGTRILLLYWPMHYNGSLSRGWMPGQWERTKHPKWEECRWVSNKDRTGSEPHWEPWCGSERSLTTEHIKPENCIHWRELPT